VFAEKQPFKGV